MLAELFVVGDAELAARIEILERSVASLQELPTRVGALEVQVLHLRIEMHAIRDELREDIASLRRQMRALFAEMQREMRLLHEDLVARIATTGDSGGGRKPS